MGYKIERLAKRDKVELLVKSSHRTFLTFILQVTSVFMHLSNFWGCFNWLMMAFLLLPAIKKIQPIPLHKGKNPNPLDFFILLMYLSKLFFLWVYWSPFYYFVKKKFRTNLDLSLTLKEWDFHISSTSLIFQTSLLSIPMEFWRAILFYQIGKYEIVIVIVYINHNKFLDHIWYWWFKHF